MGYTAKELVAIAVAQLGYKEKATNAQLEDFAANAGSNNWTKYARDLAAAGYYNGNKNGYAWCDVFVDWCFYQLADKDAKKAQEIECQTGDLGAGCTFSKQYYKAQGRIYSTPQIGDQVFYKASDGSISHTGIVETVSGNNFTTIEGNTSDRVKRCYRKLNDGYTDSFGRPKYETTTTTSTTTPTVPTTIAVNTNVITPPETRTQMQTYQGWLNKTFQFNIPISNKWDANTCRASIKAWQATINKLYSSKLEVDGDFGPLSYAAAKTHTVFSNMKNALVYVVQGTLVGNGMDPKEIDGEFGNHTKDAVIAFQKAQGLAQTGSVDAETLRQLFGVAAAAVVNYDCQVTTELNLREAPETGKVIIATPANARVVKTSEAWVKVKYVVGDKAYEGWVSTKYLKEI